MYKAQDIIPAVQDLAGEWVRHAADGTQSQTDAVVRWALSRINHADVPSVVHGVVLTLTGNRKSARKARRTAAKAVNKATQALRTQALRSQVSGRRGVSDRRTNRQQSSRRGTWLVFLAAAGLGAGAVMVWRMMVPPGEPAPVKEAETAVQPVDLSAAPPEAY
ncbi:hypothetical protein AB0N65_19935 [Paenarthrobacter sp. NPDC089322]|uniref:hypothetical protein n=1 Tax=Paenarthrobacter sp. NPDC089322 TaxID=3155065 RepID=UPI003420EACB